MADPDKRPLRILLAASGGGHWVQLKRLLPAFEGHELHFLTTEADLEKQVSAKSFRVVVDATRWSKIALIRSALGVLWAVLRTRPDIVLSTGAAPGYFACWFGKKLGARTVWVDSIANAEELSLSGLKAGNFVDLWLTQWPNLAKPNGPRFEGSVL
ncbi:MAG: UDP-N-acetylglucosamine--LPS N-acetylglucosamine transferase [Planctomycetota bacterium]